MSYLEDRFGIPREKFDGFLIFKRKQAWILLQSSRQVSLASNFRIEKAGLKAFRKVSKYIKPTTRFIQLFGKDANRARIEITQNQLFRLLNGGELAVEMSVEKGYVILSLEGRNIIGLGFYSNGRVISQLPKKVSSFCDQYNYP